MATDQNTVVATTRPYLIRAIREWALDNAFTPQILVDVRADSVTVPGAFVRDGRIVLNIHDRAVGAITLGNERIQFTARFGGQPFSVDVPVESVLAIFARENGQGIFFQSDDGSPVGPPPAGPTPGAAAQDEDKPSRKRPHLKLVQ